MSFGAELKQFVSSFQAGYKMTDGPEDREYKRARSEYLRSQSGKADRDADSNFEADRRINGGAGRTNAGSTSVAPPEEVKKIIDANTPDYLREYAYKMAKAESNYNPSIVNNKSGAAGLFQFVPNTAKQYGIAGNRALDPAENTKAFVKFTQNNERELTKLLGRKPTLGELAVAHQQGVGGAWGLFTGRSGVKGQQAGNPKNAADIARYYGFDLKGDPVQTTSTTAGPAAVPQQPKKPELESLPQKNMPEPDPNKRTAAIDGGFGGFGGFDTMQFAAEGGPIQDPTEVSDEFAAKNGLTDQGRAELVGARKAAVSMAKANNREPNLASNVGPQGATMDDYPLGNALDAGLKFIQKAFGMGQRPAVAGSDPARQQKLAAYAGGAGASDEDTDAAERAVSGGKEMPRSQVVEKTVQEVGKKYRNDPEAAGRAVGTLLQTYRQRTMKAGQQAMQQVQAGDMVGALNTLKTAYDNVPDGNSVVFEPSPDGQGYIYKQIDGKNKVIAQGPVTMQALAQQAKLAAGGLAFDSMVVRAAKPSAPTQPPPAKEAIPSQPTEPAAAPQAPQASSEAPQPDTQQVTAEVPTGTATDAAPEVPAGRTYAIDDVEREAPKPFAEAAPQLVSTEGMDPKSSGYKKIMEHNKQLQADYKARKAEWDRNENARVNRLFEIEKAAALQRDSDARRERGAKDLADRQARSQAALAERQSKSAERTAAIRAAGQTRAEEIKIAGEDRKLQQKRAEETEKANPMWERDRRLAAEADPLDARSAVAGGSPISMQDSANLKRAAEGRRAAINYDAQPPAQAYAKQEYAQRSTPIAEEITSLDMEANKNTPKYKPNPQDMRRYTALADRVAQKNDTDPRLVASMIYGMITNRWTDDDKPTVMRDGSIYYKGSMLAMPQDVLYTIIAENGRRAMNSDNAMIKQRDKDAAAKQRKLEREARFAKKDYENSDLTLEGGSAGTDLGYDTPARTPRFQAIPVDPSRLRR